MLIMQGYRYDSCIISQRNVLASGFTNAAGPAGQLLVAWLHDQFDLIISEHILAELSCTFHKPYFYHRLGKQRVANNLALLRSVARLVPITVAVQGVASHPEDDVIVATALSGQADYLITGDHHLQAVGNYQGVTILSPRGFLQQLRSCNEKVLLERRSRVVLVQRRLACFFRIGRSCQMSSASRGCYTSIWHTSVKTSSSDNGHSRQHSYAFHA